MNYSYYSKEELEKEIKDLEKSIKRDEEHLQFEKGFLAKDKIRLGEMYKQLLIIINRNGETQLVREEE